MKITRPGENVQLRSIIYGPSRTIVPKVVVQKKSNKSVKHWRWTTADDIILEREYEARFKKSIGKLVRGSISKIARMLGRTRIATSVRITNLRLKAKYGG